MITLKTLSWSNAFSYGDNNSISLGSEPITQLVGLNGHGKSSIPLILEEVLYNKNSKGILKAGIVNRELATNKYSISLDFEVFDNKYKLSVSRTGNSQKVSLLENSVDISSHTATDTFKQVENLLGFDFKTFSQVVYQNSSSSLQFLTATDTARKNFLIELLSLERYVQAFELVKKLHKNASDSLISLQSKVSTVRLWLTKAEQESQQVLTLVAVPEVDTSLELEISERSAKLASIAITNKAIQNNKQYKAILSNIDKSKLTETHEFVDTVSDEASIAKLRFEAEQESKLVKKYSAIKSGVCDSCLQPVNHAVIDKMVANSTEKIAELRLAYAEVSARLNKNKQQNTLASEHQRLVSDFEKYSNLIDLDLPELLLDKDSLVKEVSALTETLKAQQAQYNSAVSHNQKALINNAKAETLQAQRLTYLQELTEASTALDLVQNQLGLLESLKKAFSTNGLIAYKIENSVKDLEALTNEYLSELSDGRFQLEFVLNSDKLNVNIIDNGTSISIAALSAGELARVTTSTLLAIRRLMASLSKSRINVLFLDETIDNLDTYGKEKLVEVLLQEDNLNTFLISHGYTHPLINKLTVVKTAGISKLEA